MDSITQAVLGASIGEAILGKEAKNKGAILGAILATVPDLDVLLLPLYDDLQRISVHRGYSHSILFSLIGAFLFALLLKKINWTSMIGYGKLWIFAFLALFTHILLDAFTSYGTQLFLPFSDWRVSFDSIGIIDPFYTVPLVLGLFGSLYFFRNSPQKGWYNSAGLIVSSAYLLFTLLNKQGIEKIFKENLSQQAIQYQKMLTIPVSAANIKWYGVAKSDSGLYLGSYSRFSPEAVQFEYFPTNEHLLNGLDSTLVDRMRWFAQDFYTVAEKDGKIRIYNLQCDMQGVQYGEYRAPTAFYFEISQIDDTGGYTLSSGMHRPEK